ncbi:hypothetical protein QBZ16_002358 [Prototheca wickerhamii]|uniref:Single-stranded DNA binding protein Ssb-like OB fold domain-containing protein n=1 Tax=Prototheca wickerhamii TaxID=3111 RepID=A0AAD9ILT6_PROWI|nr:hypothetical protein QBZ16_002358 [Prototheca wickerhamii]
MASKDAGVATTIAALRPETDGHNVTVKVLSSKPLEKPLRFGGRSATYTECLVGDESGSILLLVQAQQAATAKVGSYVDLRGARVEMLQTSMRLLVPSTGSIEVADGQSFKPKACTDFNLSDLDFELVLVPRPGEVPAAQPGRSAAESDKADTAPVSDEDKQEVASDAPIEDGFEAALDPTDD